MTIHGVAQTFASHCTSSLNCLLQYRSFSTAQKKQFYDNAMKSELAKIVFTAKVQIL